MNYIDLINKFWLAHDEHQFNVTEIALYFYLVKWCNTFRWRSPYDRNNALINADLSISKPTLSNARNRLKQANLIDFKTFNGNPNVKYWIIEPEVEKILPAKYAGNNIGAMIGSSTSPVGGEYAHNINIKETKLNQTTYKQFGHLSITADEFDLLIDAGYTKQDIDDILTAIENYKDNKKYASLYLTAKKWLDKNAGKKQTAAPRNPDSPAKREDKKKIDKALEAFEVFKSKGKFTDWDSLNYQFLLKKGLITFDAERNGQFLQAAIYQAKADEKRLPEIYELERTGKVNSNPQLISDAMQMALMTFFTELAEVGQELKDLLK